MKAIRYERLGGPEVLEFVDQLRDATNGRGFDVVLDSVGGELASMLFDALAPFGRLVSFGVASGMPLTVASHAMMKRSVSVSGFHLDSVMALPGTFSSTLERLYGLVASGALTLSVGGVARSEDGAARQHLTGRTG